MIKNNYSKDEQKSISKLLIKIKNKWQDQWTLFLNKNNNENSILANQIKELVTLVDDMIDDNTKITPEALDKYNALMSTTVLPLQNSLHKIQM